MHSCFQKYLLIPFFTNSLASCSMPQINQHTNDLIRETSPYLLQHAHNPVNWHAWNDDILKKAKDENKIILISIGYSSCHWCHVMEHESFEDDSVAKIMNEHFISIKVDREERPDIDHLYMNAVQLMSGQGGWPLNCFALPDGKPFFGGTYFSKQNWINVLTQLAELWKNDPEKIKQYASELTEGIKKSEFIKTEVADEKTFYSKSDIDQAVNAWSASFDKKEGGPDRAPKFPMPNNYEFLLRYYYHTNNKECLNHVLLTLDKMAYGRIYDHIGGGFARYSTDKIWKVSHFEKMLYDNAQLIPLYTHAYQLTKNDLYKKVVYETLEFIEREMTSPGGGFYSALDADSEGEEGKYYVWKKEELEKLLGDKSKLFFEMYNVNNYGLWEHGNYILIRKETDDVVSQKNNLTIQQLNNAIDDCKKILFQERNKRIRPGLDDKIITSWNALMIKAYCDAYAVFGEQKFSDAALKSISFLEKNLMDENGNLLHSTHPKKLNYVLKQNFVNAFADDYAFTVEAYLAMYQSTFNETFLNKANQLMNYTLSHFHNAATGMFYFSSDTDSSLIARKTETEDNVIPASNSSIANSLFVLGHYFENTDFIQQSKKMSIAVKELFQKYPSSFSNCGILIMNHLFPFHEIVIVGKGAGEKLKELNQHFIPNKIFAGSKIESQMPLLQKRFNENNTLIYICVNKTCLLPVEESNDAFKQIQK